MEARSYTTVSICWMILVTVAMSAAVLIQKISEFQSQFLNVEGLGGKL